MSPSEVEFDVPFTVIEAEDDRSQYPYPEHRLVVLAEVRDLAAIAGWIANPSGFDATAHDFEQTVVIAVFQGQGPVGQYGVTVERVTQRNDVIQIHSILKTPGPVAADVVSSAYALVEIPRASIDLDTTLVQLVVNGAVITSATYGGPPPPTYTPANTETPVESPAMPPTATPSELLVGTPVLVGTLSP